VKTLWQCKWGLLRLAIAGFLLIAIVSDTGPRLARMQLAALPDFDYPAEIRFLRAAGRFGEAVMVADAGLGGTADAAARDAIQRERDLTIAEQQSTLRRLKDVGLGAVSGRGTSLESLVGAVAADFFVVGDIRDLVIQGGRYVLDGETDEVVLILSGVGVATTVLPEVDWVPSVLKAAKKTGAMSRRLGEWVVVTVKTGKADRLNAVFKDVRKLAERASPGGAMRMLKHADTPEDVASLARFVERQKDGAFALHVTGKEGADLIKAAKTETRIARAAGAGVEEAVIVAARKGPAGTAWLRTGGYRAMLRPHWLVGVGKALWKGNADQLAARLASELDPRAWWIIPALAAWAFLELGVLARRVWPRTASIGRLRPA
jgi:hypothetical protein